MKYKNEAEVKRALDIESWRNLSKEKIVKFAAMMPDMDTEVALKIVEQFPVFKQFALDALEGIEKQHASTLGHNKSSQDQTHLAFQETRAILKNELNRESLTWDQRKYILELIVSLASLESEKDSENKRFLGSMFQKGGAIALGALALGVVFVGGKFALQRGEDDANSAES